MGNFTIQKKDSLAIDSCMAYKISIISAWKVTDVFVGVNNNRNRVKEGMQQGKSGTLRQNLHVLSVYSESVSNPPHSFLYINKTVMIKLSLLSSSTVAVEIKTKYLPIVIQSKLYTVNCS